VVLATVFAAGEVAAALSAAAEPALHE